MKVSKLSPLLYVAVASLGAVAPATAAPLTCSVAVKSGGVVNGQSLWNDAPQSMPRGNTDCEIDQFAWNNFLYLVSDDGSGHPRFMSYAPWYSAMPAAGQPVWTGQYAPLSATQLTNKTNQRQAGDNFELLDVAGYTVAYDMRINKDFFDYIASNQLYTKAAIQSRVAAFKAAPSKGGIWLPSGAPSQGAAIEIKTAWRDYGASGSCPGDIMHCEKDAAGNWWGLVGFHLVQKTPTHGEMVWATFEHAANSPDCAQGGSNPIQRFPANPRSNLPPLNTNGGIPALASVTGWSFFNFDSYTRGGGDGANCPFPNASPVTTKSLCLTDPNPSGDNQNWLQVNVCRTDQLPKAGAGGTTPTQAASDLNSSVVAQFPTGIANKWRYYQLAGTETVFWGSSGFGAPAVGCWSFRDNTPPINCGAARGEEAVTVTRRGNANLANTTMETWMQKGISLKKSGYTLTGTDCLTCHQSPTTPHQGDLSHLFGRATQAGSSTPLSKSGEKPSK